MFSYRDGMAHGRLTWQMGVPKSWFFGRTLAAVTGCVFYASRLGLRIMGMNIRQHHPSPMTKPANPKRRQIFLATGTVAVGAGLAYVWRARNEKTYPRGNPIAVDISQLPEGKLLTINWNEKPVWVLRRSSDDLAGLSSQQALLRDADSNQSLQPESCRNPHRSIRPEVFVALGLCTHLGCVPALRSGSGFVCPCHTSRYDLAGRVFMQGPAPANLVIPAYHFEGEGQLIIGVLA